MLFTLFRTSSGTFLLLTLAARWSSFSASSFLPWVISHWADAGNSLLKSRFKPVWAFSFQQCLKICSLWCEKLLTYKKPPGQWSEGRKELAAGFSSFGSNRQYQLAESVQQWRKLWWTDSAKCRLWGISPSQGCKINKKLRIMVYFCFNVNKVS